MTTPAHAQIGTDDTPTAAPATTAAEGSNNSETVMSEAETVGVEVSAVGPSAAAALLMRSLMGTDAWSGARRGSQQGSADGTPAPPSPSGSRGHSRAASFSARSASRTRGTHGDNGGDDTPMEPAQRNLDELNDMLHELQ